MSVFDINGGREELLFLCLLNGDEGGDEGFEEFGVVVLPFALRLPPRRNCSNWFCALGLLKGILFCLFLFRFFFVFLK